MQSSPQWESLLASSDLELVCTGVDMLVCSCIWCSLVSKCQMTSPNPKCPFCLQSCKNSATFSDSPIVPNHCQGSFFMVPIWFPLNGFVQHGKILRLVCASANGFAQHGKILRLFCASANGFAQHDKSCVSLSASANKFAQHGESRRTSAAPQKGSKK